MIHLPFEHRQAGHCESGVTSNLLNFHGHKVSEPLVFGIGAGLFFSYLPFLKMQHAPMTSFRVWPGQVYERVSKKLGVESSVQRFKSEKAAMDALDRALEKGFPVGLQVGTYHLPFFPPEYRMHYNMHNMVVYGRENGHYLISDTVIEKPTTITYDDLVRVRFAKGPFAPQGRMYYPSMVPEKIDLHSSIIDGIRKTANNMTGIPFFLVGVSGIRYLSKQMRKWKKKYGEEKASYYLGQVLRMEEEIGTAGAGFRFIYGAFLHEAGEILKQDWLNELSIEMGENANRWRDFSYLGSRNCKKRSKPEESYDMLADILLDCAAKEERIFKKLAKIRKS
jgi:hypothetical protein